MLVKFEALGTSRQRKEFTARQQEASRFWTLLEESGLRAAQAHLSLTFPELDVFKSNEPGQLTFVTRERSAHPLAELIVELAPASRKAVVGRHAVSHGLALREVDEQTQVDLKTSRVRAGFTRGHLLEVVVYVPFDVSGDEETLQVAAEVYLESCLGDLFMDRWIANVSISRIARTRGLLIVADAVDQAEHYPLEQTFEMIQGAADALRKELPSSKIASSENEDIWIVLEIPPFEESTEGEPNTYLERGSLFFEQSCLRERRFASSIEPEALKAALEGMPFDSSRFTLGGELFVWCAWLAPLDFDGRLQLREELETILSREQNTKLAGTGFGPRHDFLDLWLVPDHETIERIGRVICERTGAVQLGFYDSSLNKELLEFQTQVREFT